MRVMIAALLLASCSGSGTDASGAAPSEARQLNQAAAELDDDGADNAATEAPDAPDNDDVDADASAGNNASAR